MRMRYSRAYYTTFSPKLRFLCDLVTFAWYTIANENTGNDRYGPRRDVISKQGNASITLCGSNGL
jgi:hypothetical protein